MFDLIKFQSFNIEKIIQALAYIQRKIKITDKLKLIKILFFADRLHLRIIWKRENLKLRKI
jgi:hypothetical protein